MIVSRWDITKSGFRHDPTKSMHLVQARKVGCSTSDFSSLGQCMSIITETHVPAESVRTTHQTALLSVRITHQGMPRAFALGKLGATPLALVVSAIALAVGSWYFNRAPVKDIDCPYPCDNTCHNLVFRQAN
ncbi:unnamed protein product [Lupinus luteus]|uniref:Pectin acetylesterase n=1 Tax=Lupinus luteus TaxID=3873 RepID=A0AAV1WU31_LUPLU